MDFYIVCFQFYDYIETVCNQPANGPTLEMCQNYDFWITQKCKNLFQLTITLRSYQTQYFYKKQVAIMCISNL